MGIEPGPSAGVSEEEEAGREILGLVREQVSLGPRVPGTPAHDSLADMLEDRLRSRTSSVLRQRFPVPFRGQVIPCTNLIGAFRSAHPCAGPVLLGTHYDTRPRADRETNPARRELPIPGANDGGSGTAVFQHMLDWLSHQDLPRDVLVAFFDAEDLGNIDGKDFSIGAEWCVHHPPWDEPPSEVVVLDMVGGAGMVFDIDAHSLTHPASRRLTSEIFHLGASRGWKPFAASKAQRVKYIISDHYPFVRRGIPACLLIDLDYPQWHTQDDTPQAMSTESLGITEAALCIYLSRFRAQERRSSDASEGPSAP
ncbi:MAG TPA: M28 family peptidase [Spirochaetia bacterium]|nr:M28 family peptidase [Spirochaetia bacterium]